MPMSVYGPGGTPRRVKAFTVYGPGGTARTVKNGWVYGPGGTPRLFYSGAGGFQLTAGDSIGVSTGYTESPLVGSVVPSPPFLNGLQVTMLLSSNLNNVIRLQLFSPTNPGQFAFNTLTISPIWFGNASAATYTYSGQTAQWDWAVPNKMVVGNVYTVSVT